MPGVVNVAIWGERLQQQHVNVDPARMAGQDVTLDEVMNATADSLDAGLLRYADFGNVIGTGGFVDTANQRLGIRHVLPIKTPHDLAKVPIERAGGKPVRIGDVAKVQEGHQPLVGDAVVNERPRPAARRREGAGRQHREGDQRHRRRARRSAARPARHPVRRQRSSARRTSSSTAIDNLTLALLLGSCS